MTITVTGGSYSTDGTYGIRTFNSSDDLEVSGGTLDVEYLLIAGVMIWKKAITKTSTSYTEAEGVSGP